jgi:hypothetical protein
MGSQEDNSLDGLLRRSLARGAAPDECPGPDLLAAYSERTLEADEAARFEQHFSKCPRCREVLAAIVRVNAEAEVPQEAVPIMAAAAPARETGLAAYSEPKSGEERASSVTGRDKAPSRPLRWWWLAPAAATAVLAVFIYVRHQSTAPPALNMSRQLATSRSEPGVADEKKAAPPEEKAPVAAVASSTPTDQELKKRDEMRSADKKKSIQNLPSLARNYEQIPTPAAGAPAGAAPAAPTPLEKSAPAPTHAKISQGVVSGGADGGAAGGVGAAPPRPSEKAAPTSVPAPAPQSEAVQVEQQAADLDQLQRQTQQQQLQQQQQLTPQDEAVAQAKLKAENRKALVTSAANMMSTIISIPTPDKQVVYRIVGAGLVERTTDGGATWQGQLVSQNADFTAGSAPSAKICWLVGRAGAIFRTSDGTNWKKIPPPAIVDLVGVNATDASTATVTSAGGKKYSTENAGKIWIASR